MAHIVRRGGLMLMLMAAAAAAAAAGPRRSIGIVADGDDDRGDGNGELLDVHIVPHSHQDVGWIETADWYYENVVKGIYDTVVAELAKDAARTFTCVEMYFVHRWWTDPATTPAQQAQFRALVASGQIELVNAGWVMHDGSLTDYQACVNQMTLGHAFAARVLGGAPPSVGWHIDPFGASALTPAHMALMGFNAFVFNRIPDKGALEENKTMEFVWRGSSSLPAAEQACFSKDFGPGGYTADYFLLFDEPMTVPVTDLTAPFLARDLAKGIRNRAQHLATPHMLYPWGSDFEFFNATLMYDNMDKLMTYINARPDDYGMLLHYATPGEYFATLHDDGRTWTTRGARDFFPYSTGSQYWTGFFTSRPRLKRVARRGDEALRFAEMSAALAGALHPGPARATTDLAPIEALRQACAVVQHHDAITGTESSWVVADYVEHIENASTWTEPLSAQALALLATQSDPGSQPPALTHDPAVVAHLQSGQAVPVVVFNPVAWSVATFVSVPTDEPHLVVANSSGPIPSQVLPRFNPFQTPGPGYELVFPVQLPPLGFSTYFVTRASSDSVQAAPSRPQRPAANETFAIENGDYVLSFDSETGLLATATIKSLGVTVDATQAFFEYASYDGPGGMGGAYIFEPAGPASPVSPSGAAAEVVSGPCVQEVRQVFSPRHAQVTRLYVDPHASSSHVLHVRQFVGPLQENRECVTRITTSIDSQGAFRTDNNGLEMRTRARDPARPIPGNYYPLVAMASLAGTTSAGDGAVELVVLTSRSHGVTSLVDGELEVMVHRRVLTEDGKGPVLLNDTDVLEDVEFRIALAEPAVATRLRHEHRILQQFPPVMLFAAKPVSDPSQWCHDYRCGRQLLTAPLPPNIHLMTLSPPPLAAAAAAEVLFRMVHLFESGEDATLSKPVTLSLDTLFADLTVASCEERSLTSLWKWSDMHRWTWKTNDTASGIEGGADGDAVTLGPMQIRTFALSLTPTAID